MYGSSAMAGHQYDKQLSTLEKIKEIFSEKSFLLEEPWQYSDRKEPL